MNKTGFVFFVSLLLVLLAGVSLLYGGENEEKLMNAAKTGDAATVKQLLKDGAAADAVDSHKFTPMMSAAEKGHVDVVRALLMWGAKLNLQNERGMTALMLAAAEGKTPIVEMLLKAGADARIEDQRGWTAAKWAGLSDYRQIVALLGGGESSEDDTKLSVQKGTEGTETDQSKIAVVVGVDSPDNCLRIRLGPGGSYEKIGCAKLGENLVISGKLSNDNRWAEILEPVKGWVYLAQVESDGLPKVAPRVSTGTSSPTGSSSQETVFEPTLMGCLDACDEEYRLTFGPGVRLDWMLCRRHCKQKFNTGPYWQQ